MMRDADFGMVRLRAFGIYSMRVADPRDLIKQKLPGTNAPLCHRRHPKASSAVRWSARFRIRWRNRKSLRSISRRTMMIECLCAQKLQDEFKSLDFLSC